MNYMELLETYAKPVGIVIAGVIGAHAIEKVAGTFKNRVLTQTLVDPGRFLNQSAAQPAEPSKPQPINAAEVNK